VATSAPTTGTSGRPSFKLFVLPPEGGDMGRNNPVLTVLRAELGEE
jgi:hypothetical protein